MARRRPRRRRRAGGSRSGGSYMTSYLTGTIANTQTVVMNANNLEIPPNRPFKVLGLHYDFATMVGQSGTVIIRIYAPTSTAEGTWDSGPVIVPSNGRRGTLRNRSSLWYADNISSTTAVVGAMDALCQKSGDSYRLRFAIKIRIELGPETFTEACPKTLTAQHNPLLEPPPGTSDEEEADGKRDNSTA